MSDVVGIAIEKWSHEKRKAATNWLHSLYGSGTYKTWYIDIRPIGCEDLVMREDIYFLFKAAFGNE